MDWPQNYIAELTRRAELELGITRNPQLLRGAFIKYATSVTDFANDACWIHEPRNANLNEPVFLPVVLFPRQEEFLNWLVERYRTRTSAPVEKARDSGATWMSCVFAVWLWLAKHGTAYERHHRTQANVRGHMPLHRWRHTGQPSSKSG
jgi:hypothetical protein